MEVRAAGGHQPELGGQRQAARALAVVVERVVALEADHAEARRLAHEAAQAGLVGADDAGVGDDGQAAGAADEAERRPPAPEPAAVHEGRRAAAQEALERLADGAHVAAPPHGLADVRPADGAAAGDLCELARVERVAELAQALQDARVALVAAAAQPRQLRPELVAGRAAEEVAEHVEGSARTRG